MHPTAYARAEGNPSEGILGRTIGRDTLAVTAEPHLRVMIYFECSWCDGDMTLEAIDATSVECHDCGISIDIAPDESTKLPIAA